ncbi:MAG: hypothetical protein Q8R34_00375 [bacterium]|nr:hypothetical protein [bacterium]
MSGKISYWTPQRIEWLRENCNELKSKILRKLRGKTWKAIKHVMGQNDIHRDRDKATNKTKAAKKWTPEKIEELREYRNDSWETMEERFKCSRGRIEQVMSKYNISRDRQESTLWTDETDKLLINAILESNKYNTKTGEGRRQLRQTHEKLVAELKKAGFKGHTSKNAIRMHTSQLTADRIKAIGFVDISTPLGWGAPMELFGRGDQPVAAAKTTEQENSKPAKDIWVIQGLEARCRKLVEERWLVRDKGVAHILTTINEEFAEKLSDGLQFTIRHLAQRINKLIWTPEVIREHKRAIRNRLPLDEFRQQYFSYIPEKRWKRQTKLRRGLSDAHISASFIAGVGRLITEELGPNAERFEFPLNSYEHPFEIKADKDWTIPVLNAANIGIVFDPNIEDNPLRRALSDAKKRRSSGVIITNLIDLYMKKTAGVGHIYRAQASGIHIKLEHLPESYRAEAARIMKERPNDEAVYQNIAARFLGILDALKKITHGPKGPEFNGPVLYTLGYKEEELIAEAANAELRYMSIQKQNQLRSEMQTVNWHRAKAEKDENWDDADRWERRQGELSQQLAISILTNFSDEDRNYQRRRIRALFVTKIQEVIPNCTVVTQGSARFKVGDKTIKIHIPHNVKVSDTHLASYVDSYGAEVFEDTLADITVICSPYPLNHRFVGREDSKDGQPITKFVHEAPMLADDVYLQEQFKDTTRNLHPVQQCIKNPQFQPGMLIISCTDGLVSADSVPIAKINRTPKVNASTNFAYPYPETKYINGFLNSDNHIGAPDRREIWDPKNRIHLGSTEAAIEILRREGMLNPNDCPFHFTAEMDDATNGDLWFNPRYRPDPNEMLTIQIDRWLRQMTRDIQRAAEKGDMKEVARLTEELHRINVAQLYLKGEDFPFHQMVELFDRHIEPNVDFYSAVLGRFVKSGLTIRGISKINKNMTDTRDLGVHNFPNGNHRVNSLEQKDLEGDHMARELKNKLLQLPEWQKYTEEHLDFLHESVRAPRYGNVTFGWGTIKSPTGFEWGLRVHASPARQKGWSDILAAQLKIDLARGDDTYGLMKFYTVAFFGDKHFYAKAETRRHKYVMCAAGVHTNQYGSVGGFPPNNTGPCVVSIPADGPDAGPFIVRPLPHDVLRDYFEKGKLLSLKKLIPKPV